MVFNSLTKTPVSSQNFLNDSGLDNLHASSAFPKIRNNTKIYNTHLLNLTSADIQKSYKLAEHYNNSTDFLMTLDHTINRPSNFLTSISYLNPGINNLNSNTFSNFLNQDDNPVNANNITDNSINDNSTKANPYLVPTSRLLSLPTLSDSEDKILPTEQFILQQKVFNPLNQNTNPILLTKEHSISNLNNTLLSQSLKFTEDTFTTDQNFANVLSSRVFTVKPLTPVLSSTPLRADNFTSAFDGTEVNKLLTLSSTKLVSEFTTSPNSTVEANVGSVEKIPTPLLEMY